MSYRVVKQVLNIDPAKLSGVAERFMLTVYAEHADPDGSNAFPALPRLARLLGISEDRAFAVRRTLREDGWIILTKRTRYYSVFRIDMEKVRLCAYAESDPNPDSVPAQGPDSEPAQGLTLCPQQSDSVPAQSNSSLPVLDSPKDSPTPRPIVSVCVSVEPKTPKKPKDPMTEFYEAVAFHAWLAFAGEDSTMVPAMKTRASMGRALRDVLDYDNEDQWDAIPPSLEEVNESITGVIQVMEYARRAQDKYPDRFILKNPLAILKPENFDMLTNEADRALKTIDAHSRQQVSSILECWDTYLEETNEKGSAA